MPPPPLPPEPSLSTNSNKDTQAAPVAVEALLPPPPHSQATGTQQSHTIAADDAPISDIIFACMLEAPNRGSPKLVSLSRRCQGLIARDYFLEVIENVGGELCPSYPLELFYIVSEKADSKEGGPEQKGSSVSNSRKEIGDGCPRPAHTPAAKDLHALLKGAQFARCRKRFPFPTLFFNNKHICRSATLSIPSEIYCRRGLARMTSYIGTSLQLTAAPQPHGDNTNGTPVTLSCDASEHAATTLRGEPLLQQLGSAGEDLLFEDDDDDAELVCVSRSGEQTPFYDAVGTPNGKEDRDHTSTLNGGETGHQTRNPTFSFDSAQLSQRLLTSARASIDSEHGGEERQESSDGVSSESSRTESSDSSDSKSDEDTSEHKAQVQETVKQPPQSQKSSDSGNATPSTAEGSVERHDRLCDARLLQALGVKVVFDLMVENRKLKYGFYVSTSEKVVKEMYADFSLTVVPYPGVELFSNADEPGFDSHMISHDWDTPEFDAEHSLSRVDALSIDFSEYRKWSLREITNKYLKLLIHYASEPESTEGILIHCISGWDRTPLFASLIRITLWADGLAHKSLSAEEFLVLTVGYDWLLFGHQLHTRMKKKENIFYFCFDYLKDIVDEDFASPLAADKTVRKGRLLALRDLFMQAYAPAKERYVDATSRSGWLSWVPW